MSAMAQVASKTEILDFLSTVPVLKHLEPRELERLADMLQPRDVAADELIVQEGQPAQDMYIVYDGSVRASESLAAEGVGEGWGAPLRYYTKGEVFGEMSYFDKLPRSATVIAAAPSTLLTLRYADLDKLIEYDGLLASRLFIGIVRDLSRIIRDTDRSVRLLFKRLIVSDPSIKEILVQYSANEELRQLFGPRTA